MNKAILFWVLTSLSTPLLGTPRVLLPSMEEQRISNVDRDKILSFLRICFLPSKYPIYPTGTLTLAVIEAPTEARIESSSFRNEDVPACVLSKTVEYRRFDSKKKDWSYIHLISECKKGGGPTTKEEAEVGAEAENCHLTILLNNEGVPPSDKDAKTIPNLFPDKSDEMNKSFARPLILDLVRPCFKRIDRSQFQGYARLSLATEANSIRIERTTFSNDFLNSCLQSSLAQFYREDLQKKTWQKTHIVSNCPDVDSRKFKADACRIEVLLNDFSEDKEIQSIVESQWSAPIKEEYNAAALATLRIIEILTLAGHLIQK